MMDEKPDFKTFVSKYLEDIINMEEFERAEPKLKEKISQLSVLINNISKFDDYGQEDDNDNMVVKQKCETVIKDEDYDHSTYYDDSWNSDFEDHTERKPTKKVKMKRKKKKMKEEDDMKVRRCDNKRIDATTMEERVVRQCEDCNYKCESLRQFTRHMFDHHEQTLCSFCGISFTEFIPFWNHQESHENKFSCNLCDHSFRSRALLRNHLKLQHKAPVDSSEYNYKEKVCQECGKTVKNLQNHMSIFHSGRVFQCQFCDFKTKYEQACKKHELRQHSSNAYVTCPFCNKKIKHLQDHLMRTKCDKPIEERNANMLKCSFENCPRLFNSRIQQLKHEQEFHGEPKQCNFCSFKSKYAYNMRQHLKKTHGVEAEK